ncbi:MAG: entericidin A/B family lipoprotein [Burkholderiales bacterium]
MFNKLFAILLALLFVAGCNTMAGFGKDVEKLGDKIEDKAVEKKKY